MFANTYHLALQPGAETVGDAGGLHRFMGRDAPIITDSGGFQVFSLGPNAEDGLEMKSPVAPRSAAPRRRGPSDSNQRTRRAVQELPRRLARGAHPGVVRARAETPRRRHHHADELPPYHIDRDVLERSVYMRHRWEARSLAIRTHLADAVRQQAMYAVIHGGVDRELRKMSAEYLGSLPFDGFAIGGSLGRDTDELVQLLAILMPLLPDDRPNHLLRIGDVGSILGAIPHGRRHASTRRSTRNASRRAPLSHASRADKRDARRIRKDARTRVSRVRVLAVRQSHARVRASSVQGERTHLGDARRDAWISTSSARLMRSSERRFSTTRCRRDLHSPRQ